MELGEVRLPCDKRGTRDISTSDCVSSMVLVKLINVKNRLGVDSMFVAQFEKCKNAPQKSGIRKRFVFLNL